MKFSTASRMAKLSPPLSQNDKINLEKTAKSIIAKKFTHDTATDVVKAVKK